MSANPYRGGVKRYLDTVKPEEYKPDTGEVDLSELSLTGLADLYGSDKGTIKHGYTKHYEHIIQDILDTAHGGLHRKSASLSIVEAGVACGASLRMWGNYLPGSHIIGYDIRPECAELCKDMLNVEIRIGDLCKKGLAEEVDLFVDDASHITEDMMDMFGNCFKNVAEGGYYVIEDMGCTYNHAYTKQFREHFRKDAVNDRSRIVSLIDQMLMEVDARGSIAEIRYYPQMLVIKKR